MNGTGQIDLFPVRIYRVSVQSDELRLCDIRKKVLQLFSDQMHLPQHPLERGAADSTYKTAAGLDELLHSDAISPLGKLVLVHARRYWESLQYDPHVSLRIEQCWANVHRRDGMTLEHNHSPIHMNAVYYLDVPEGSGPLVLRNPLEYTVANCPLASPDDVLERKLEVQAGDLVIIPGWLNHYVPASRSDDMRIVLTFNIVGHKHREAQRECEVHELLRQECERPAAAVARELLHNAEMIDLHDVRERFIKEHPLTLADTLRVEREVLKFLVLCAMYKDYPFPMGGLPDMYWHALILHTRTYEKLCFALRGSYIHHEPAGSAAPADLQERISAFFQHYHGSFCEPVPTDLWPFSDFVLVNDPN
jgi:uncharacterized protein (TIGR02466 family)